jgi:hypothetical protein
MVERSVLKPILDDEALTRHLGDAEARVLVEWLVEEIEQFGLAHPPDVVDAEVKRLCRRGRGLARFVRLWSHEDAYGAATQLAASERFYWPLPDGPIDPWLLMQRLVTWESSARRAA